MGALGSLCGKLKLETWPGLPEITEYGGHEWSIDAPASKVVSCPIDALLSSAELSQSVVPLGMFVEGSIFADVDILILYRLCTMLEI